MRYNTIEVKAMLYCTKCRAVCEDTVTRCPSCKSSRLRTAYDNDLVRLHRADEYTAGRLRELFDEAGLIYAIEPFSDGQISHFYDAEILPTDKNIFVRFADLDAAKKIAEALKEEIDRANGELDPGPDETEELPRKKRIVLEMTSVIIFMVLVMLAVFGADAFANWVRSFFV